MQFFNLLAQLLLKCGFYSRAANLQSSVSASPVKVVWHMCNESAIGFNIANVAKLFKV